MSTMWKSTFIPGVYHEHPFDTARARSMYGGLAVALMLPETRSEQLQIYQSQQGLFDVVFQSSRYRGTHYIKQRLVRAKRRLFG